jgi:hypothetical protein
MHHVRLREHFAEFTTIDRKPLMGEPAVGELMDHTAVPVPPEFDELSTEEKIEYVSALWDRIFADDCELPVPEWHLRLVEERLAEYRKHPETSRPAREILERLVPGHEWPNLG